MGANPVSDQIPDYAVAKTLCISLYCGRDVIKMIASFCKLNPFKKNFVLSLPLIFLLL